MDKVTRPKAFRKEHIGPWRGNLLALHAMILPVEQLATLLQRWQPWYKSFRYVGSELTERLVTSKGWTASMSVRPAGLPG